MCSRERPSIGHQCKLDQLGRGQRCRFGQRMILWQHQAPLPLKTGQYQQIAPLLQIIGKQQIGSAIMHGCSALRRTPLHHRYGNFGKAGHEALEDGGQNIAGLQMSGRNGEGSLLRMHMLPGHHLDGGHLVQHLRGHFDHVPTDGGDLGQVFAAALEDLDPQLILQHPHLFADPGLGGKEALGGGRQIQPVVRHLDDIAQLLQFHGVALKRTHR